MSLRNRRQILKTVGLGALGFLGAKYADAVLSEPVGELGHKTWRKIHGYWDDVGTKLDEMDPIDAAKLRLVSKLFCDRGAILKLVGGHAHHLYQGQMHPDDQLACNEIIRSASALAITVEHADDKLQPHDKWTGSFVCTGSPVSNDRTRTFLEYSYVDAANPDAGLARASNPRMKLPFEYLLDRAQITKNSKRRQRGEAGKLVPNWALKSESGFLRPGVGEEETDFLLVSRIPNWVDQPRSKYKDFDSGVTIFGGTHGIGTAAVALLIGHLELLQRLERLADEFEYWQAVIKVESVRRQPHPCSSAIRPMAIGLCGTLIGSGKVTVL